MKPKPLKLSPRSKDLPATQGMLHLVRNELQAETRELRAEMKAGFLKVDARFEKVDSQFERVNAEISRIGLLVEEQNSRNQIVLEGLTGLSERQDRLEKRMDDNTTLLQDLIVYVKQNIKPSKHL